MRLNSKAVRTLYVVVSLTLIVVLAVRQRPRRTRPPAPKVPIEPAAAVSPAPVSAAAPELPARVFESYAGYRAESRRQLRFALDLPPQDWAPGRGFAFKDLGPLPFTAADLPAAIDLDRAKAEHQLVRPAPYPYYRILSIPSDCCGSHYSDVFYTQALLSRRFGLDTGSSFFPFSARGAAEELDWGGVLALFWKGQKHPRVAPVRIETEDIDALPLFLCYWYRGWIDHLHSWSSENTPAVSLLAKASCTLDADCSAELALQPQGKVSMEFQGLLANLALSEEVEAFELTLVDRQDLPHHVVYKIDLAGRPGWDLSSLPRERLSEVTLSLAEESNRKPLRGLGRASADGTVFKAASLKVQGKKGATVEIAALRAYDLTRAMIVEHMAQLRQYNILPIVSTNHGGEASWAAMMPEASCKIQGQLLRRPALGARPGAPAYHADLLRGFGVDFLLGLAPQRGNRLRPLVTEDGTSWYEAGRDCALCKDRDLPAPSTQLSHFENLGRLLVGFLAAPPEFGDARCIYTHFNLYNAEAFAALPFDTAQMSIIKQLHPHTEAALAVLANVRHDLDGKRSPHERVWTCPVSVQMRYLQVRQGLADQARLEGDIVHITPWTDAVTGRTVPDPKFLSQDLHGQTFYVPDASRARVFVGETELTCLQRNPADFSGRASVTIVDTTTPTVVFDEVDLYEQNGRTIPEGASCFFRRDPCVGQYALEIQAEKQGTCRVLWEPYRLNSHETEYLHFAYKKSNPKTAMVLSVTLEDGTETVVTEGELRGRQGWEVRPADSSGYHEVVVSFADLRAAADGSKRLPRGEIHSIGFGLEQAVPGDSVFFDRVEFLAARGVRPHGGHGLVGGGRLYPPQDGETITLTRAGQTERTTTTRGGWFFFTGIPPETIVEIAYEKDGVKYFPLRGRLTQIVRNDVELHIHALDPRSPFVPRPRGYVGLPVTEATAPRETGSGPQRQELEALYPPHAYRFYAGNLGWKRSYMVEEHVNNHGFVDRDRRFDNPDHAIRIFLQGDCWTEGLQTLTHEHMNMLLESLLRRRFGVPVEVIVSATSSASPASYSLGFEKYGTRFRPDLVLMFVSPANMVHLEPSMLRSLIGWDKEHSPYKMYDFDAKGNLVAYPPDPEQYGAFTVPPDNKALIGTVPLLFTFSAVWAEHPLVQRGFDLFRAILRDQYLARLKAGSVGVIFGHDNLTPRYGLRYTSTAVADEVWRNAVKELCEEIGVAALDLAPHLPRSRYTEMAWEHDGHLTATANYRFAAALAEEIVKLPEFRRLVEQRRRK